MSNGRHALTISEFTAVAQRLDELIREFEALPYPVIRERVFEALHAIDALHREGITRLVELVGGAEREAMLEHAQRDPIVRTLLVLYDLLPDDFLPPLPTAQDARNFIALNQLQIAPKRPKQPSFIELGAAAQVPPGTVKEFQLNGLWVLVANLDGGFYAVRDQCPGSMAPLHLGAYKPPVIVCPWHNEAYDMRTGKRVDGESEPKLQLLPIFADGGVLKLAADSVASKPVV